MYPTVTVEHLASVTTATDDSDDMKIYEFDREPRGGVTITTRPCVGTSPGGWYSTYDNVLAAA